MCIGFWLCAPFTKARTCYAWGCCPGIQRQAWHKAGTRQMLKGQAGQPWELGASERQPPQAPGQPSGYHSPKWDLSPPPSLSKHLTWRGQAPASFTPLFILLLTASPHAACPCRFGFANAVPSASDASPISTHLQTG